jgi:DTW domain-containing protein YfiP
MAPKKGIGTNPPDPAFWGQASLKTAFIFNWSEFNRGNKLNQLIKRPAAYPFPSLNLFSYSLQASKLSNQSTRST